MLCLCRLRNYAVPVLASLRAGRQCARCRGFGGAARYERYAMPTCLWGGCRTRAREKPENSTCRGAHGQAELPLRARVMEMRVRVCRAGPGYRAVARTRRVRALTKKPRAPARGAWRPPRSAVCVSEHQVPPDVCSTDGVQIIDRGAVRALLESLQTSHAGARSLHTLVRRAAPTNDTRRARCA